MYILNFTDNKGGACTIAPTDYSHYLKLKDRFIRRGWREVPYVVNEIKESYPF